MEQFKEKKQVSMSKEAIRTIILRDFINGREWQDDVALAFKNTVHDFEAVCGDIGLQLFMDLARQAFMLAGELNKWGHPYTMGSKGLNPYNNTTLRAMCDKNLVVGVNDE